MRPDDPLAIAAHKDRFYGGAALIVLGGPSGENWEELVKKIKPDVILTANGKTDLPGADYWILAENMSYQNGYAERGNQRAKEFMRMVNAPNTAQFRLISHRSWHLVRNQMDCIRIRRIGWELIDQKNFSLRNYGEGFFYGPLFTRNECVRPSIRFHVGTVAAHLLHLAGILGCSEVHTVGMDFCFKDKHHWYSHPQYEADRFRTEAMFTEYKGLQTQWDWIEGAQWLKSIEWVFERDGLEWFDYSDGLLKAEGLQCAQ